MLSSFLLRFECTTHRKYKLYKEKSGDIISLQIWLLSYICILKYANLWHFATSGQETFYYPDFLFHIPLISELNFFLVYILAGYHTYQGEFFAPEVAHFFTHFKTVRMVVVLKNRKKFKIKFMV